MKNCYYSTAVSGDLIFGEAIKLSLFSVSWLLLSSAALAGGGFSHKSTCNSASSSLYHSNASNRIDAINQSKRVKATDRWFRVQLLERHRKSPRRVQRTWCEWRYGDRLSLLYLFHSDIETEKRIAFDCSLRTFKEQTSRQKMIRFNCTGCLISLSMLRFRSCFVGRREKSLIFINSNE